MTGTALPADHRLNNFDLLRIAAALQVAIVHSCVHLRAGARLVALLDYVPGVPIFFVISGFLVSASLERSTLTQYAANRLLRIYPGLWVCLLVSIGIALAFGVSFPARASALWLAAQLSIVQFYNPAFLRGFGVGVLNGSLWTIPVELQFYGLLPLIYAVLRRSARPEFVLAALLGAGIVVNQLWLAQPSTTLGYKLFAVCVLPHLYLFLVGVLLNRHFARLRPLLAGRALYWVALFAASSVLFKAVGFGVQGNDLNPVSAIVLGITTISLAYSRPSLSRWLHGNDASFGLYIYHMPVVNGLLAAGWHGAGAVAAAVGIGLGLALLSWRLIERPALALKGRVAQALAGAPALGR